MASIRSRLRATGGVTTLVDAGSAGPGNFAGFREHVIEPSPVRILAYLNISFAGIYGFSKRIMVGESGDQRLLAPVDAVEVARRQSRCARRHQGAGRPHRERRIRASCPLDIARQAADRLGMPMMVHIDEPPPTLEDVLARMRPGDILTHCFRPFPNTPAIIDGKDHPAVLEARERGIIFDIGHGMGSFSFDDRARRCSPTASCPTAFRATSTRLCIEGPAFDLVTTMSKFLCLGMPLTEVIQAATVNARPRARSGPISAR